MPSSLSERGLARDIVSFTLGALTILGAFLGLAKPMMERVADERAMIVEQRINADVAEKFRLLLEEVRVLRSEIADLRMEVSNGPRK